MKIINIAGKTLNFKNPTAKILRKHDYPTCVKMHIYVYYLSILCLLFSIFTLSQPYKVI